MKYVKIFWIKIHKLKYKKFLIELFSLKKRNIVFTPNPEILLQSKNDKKFKQNLKKASYLTPDGIGLYIAFQVVDNSFGSFINILLLPYFFFNLFFRRKYLYKKYGERICGSDLTKDIIQLSEQYWAKVTIIDLYNPSDEKKVASQKVFPKLLKKKFPELQFDYFIFQPGKKDKIIKKIKHSDSQILFSTLGMKAQEKSIIEVMDECKNIRLWLWVGSSFDYFIGFQKRAPKIMRILWIEWLYRLFTGPKKIQRIQRLYTAIFVFLFEVLKK